jgi:cholesterol oxidase
MRRRLFLPLTRRTFVKTTAAGAAVLAAGCDGAGAPSVEEVDNLIIGSGFGGAITAHRLAEAGHASTILERGRRWEIETPGDDVFSDMGFTNTAELDDRYDNRSAWLATTQPLPGIPASRPFQRYTGVLERIPGDGLDVVCAAAVGGGSVVYSGMMVRPQADLFDAIFPPGLGSAAMDPYFARVLEIMQPAAMPDSLLARQEWTASRVFIDQAMRAGIDVERILCAFDWSRAEAEVRGEVPPQLIRGSYIFGLNSGAKISLDKRYLGMAEETGLCDVRPLHWAQRVIKDGARWRVEVDRIETDGTVVESLVFVARRLFLCAGTMNTTGLLLRARDERTIPDLPDTLGAGLGNNAQHIMAREDVGVDTGAFQAGPACIMMFDRSTPIAMENGPAPLGMERQLLIGTGQGVPSGRGAITWDAVAKKVSCTWSASNDAEAHAHARALVQRLNTANAGVDATSSLGLDVSITFHPLGGCVMGQTTDLHGRITAHPGLYVIDGSLIPGCTPLANPFWTISANSERCIETILAEDLSADEEGTS